MQMNCCPHGRRSQVIQFPCVYIGLQQCAAIMKQCKDNCLSWQLANRLALCYCQACPSCPPPVPDYTPVCIRVYLCVLSAQRKSVWAHCKINRLLYKGHYPQLCEWLAFAEFFFLIPLLFPFAFKRHRNGACGTVEYMYNH